MKKKLIIAMPIYKMMEANSIESLLTMITDLYSKTYDIRIAIVHGLNVVEARKKLVETIIEMPFEPDYVLWLDSDHIYKSDTFNTLVDKLETNNLEMLSAAYRQRGGKFYSHCLIDEENTKVLHIKYDPALKGIIPVDVVGFGFLVMKYDLLKRLYTKYRNLFAWVGLNGVGGEDNYFCNLAKKEGVKVCFDAETKVDHLQTVLI